MTIQLCVSLEMCEVDGLSELQTSKYFLEGLEGQSGWRRSLSLPPCLLPPRSAQALLPRPCQTHWCVQEPNVQLKESWLPSQWNFQIEQRNLGRFVDVLVITSNSKLFFLIKPGKRNPL